MKTKRDYFSNRNQHRDIRHLQQQLEELRDLLQERGGKVKEATLGHMNELGKTLKHYYEHSRERVDEVEEDVSSFVRTRPLQALLAALGVGFLLSLFFRRSR